MTQPAVPAKCQRACLAHVIATAILGWLASAPSGAMADCLDDAAARSGQAPLLVRAIAWQESGMRPDVVRRNRNGTEDIGLMQINSVWLPKLARWGITRAQLLDACVNAYVGTWILASNIQTHGRTWRAVGAYNAVSPDKQLHYASQVYARWLRLQRSQAQ